MDEKRRIAMLAHLLYAEGAEDAGVEVGIGDDAAVLAASHAARSHLVWTIDEQVEGVHFRREFLSWHDVGWRSFMAGASDITAMGAVPWCALSALSLSDDVSDAALEEIALGQGEAAAAVRAPVVGGNLSRVLGEKALSITTTLLGTCERAVERRGARPGDALWMAGHVGLATAGLKTLQRRADHRAPLAAAVAAWRSPRALVAEGRAMAVVANAAVDVSDGLALDAGHLGEASGVCVVLYEANLLADETLCAAAELLGESPLELALYGGEDYALVVASSVPIPGFRRIGHVREGEGVMLRGEGGEEKEIEAKGYDHFAGKGEGRG
jgi:thiamine-monophosphate kinase